MVEFFAAGGDPLQELDGAVDADGFLDAGGFQDAFENAERPGIGRRDGWAANEIAGNGNGIIHAPRLTCDAGDGPALCDTNSSSVCWSQRGLVSRGASGSGPNRLGAFAPLRQNSSTKHQTPRPKARAPARPAKTGFSSQSASLSSRLGAMKKGTSHQPLLLRSCSRLIEAAAKRHAKKTVIGMMTICGNSEASPVNRIDAEMTTRLMASGPPMPRIMIRIASNSSTEIMPQRMLSVASQYLAQLMRPSKRNRNQK